MQYLSVCNSIKLSSHLSLSTDRRLSRGTKNCHIRKQLGSNAHGDYQRAIIRKAYIGVNKGKFHSRLLAVNVT